MAKAKTSKTVKHKFPKSAEGEAKEESVPMQFWFDRRSNLIVRSAKLLPEPDYSGPHETFLGCKKSLKGEFKERERDIRDQWMKVRKQRLKNLEVV